ncbi:MAG: hypothetical protein FIA99_18100 [Ruminiclostridium sp.]|nr:hypothetical protein [Ruminiclostridium sp.]
MNKKTLCVIVVLCSLLLPIESFATVSGYSDGGDWGITYCNGDASAINGSWPSNDSGSAYTQSQANGSIGVGVYLHYATEGSGDNVVSNYGFDSDTYVSTSVNAPNRTGTYVNSGHTYDSVHYGSWSGGGVYHYF